MKEIGSNKLAGWFLFAICAIVSAICAYRFFAVSGSFEYFCGMFTVSLGVVILLVIYSRKGTIKLLDDRMETGSGITIFWKEVKRVAVRTWIVIPVGISIDRKERSTIHIGWIDIDCGCSALADHIVEKANEATA